MQAAVKVHSRIERKKVNIVASRGVNNVINQIAKKGVHQGRGGQRRGAEVKTNGNWTNAAMAAIVAAVDEGMGYNG
jgi:hypothetical protein